MSNDGSMKLWVSDIDGYVDIDAINRANERERLEDEFPEGMDDMPALFCRRAPQRKDAAASILLLSSARTSAELLLRKGISNSEWRYALHLARTALDVPGRHPDEISPAYWKEIEHRFVKSMLDAGRAYAVARYAKWEGLDSSSAITAVLPHGIRALVNQMLRAEGIPVDMASETCVRGIFAKGDDSRMTAYVRTGHLQIVLHGLANDTAGHPGAAMMDKDRMRSMLSLARLHFSARELGVDSLSELQRLMAMYGRERDVASKETASSSTGRAIRSWRLRHVRPLLDLYPYSIRHGVRRALQHQGERQGQMYLHLLLNEIALARCGILQMRRASRKVGDRS